MNKNHFCIIMAGGLSNRFWPLSKTAKPKQFIDILGMGKTPLQQTYERMTSIYPQKNIFIVTSEEFKDITKTQIPTIAKDQIILEPTRRNTAPCIAMANEHIKSINPDALITVTPADHLITNEENYKKVILEGLEFVKDKDILLTIGIKPTRAETDYGYIQVSDPNCKETITQIKNFTEKPNQELANFFLQTDEFYWNSGIFMWSLTSITKAFYKYLPETIELFEGYQPSTTNSTIISEIYSGCKNISIDYGIIEKAENVYVYKADFGWTDIGTWKSLYENHQKSAEGNVTNNSNILTYDTTDSIIISQCNKITAIQGLEGYIVIETKDALLICKRAEEGRLRQIVNDIKFKKGDKFI